jgi:hypothetical protein
MAKEKCKALEAKSAGTQHRHREPPTTKTEGKKHRRGDGEASLRNEVVGLQEMEAGFQAAKRGAD